MARGVFSRILFWGGLSLPTSTVAFVLSLLYLYIAGVILGARLPGLDVVNWVGAWLIALVLSLLKVILTIATVPDDSGGIKKGDVPVPGPE